MTSLIAGLLCCDEQPKDSGDGYTLHFNGGRLLGAFVVILIGMAFAIWVW